MKLKITVTFQPDSSGAELTRFGFESMKKLQQVLESVLRMTSFGKFVDEILIEEVQ